MTLFRCTPIRIALVTSALAVAGATAIAQDAGTGTGSSGPRSWNPASASNPATAQQPAAKPLAAIPTSVPAPAMATPTRKSMLDEPASAASIQVTKDGLSISATNASLSEVIRQVAERTGMQVEGNSRDERVFGVYGPGSPPEVLSSLLYDSGYNVIMVGSTADGEPRRLVLSPRSAPTGTTVAAATSTSNDDDDDQPETRPAEVVQPPPTPAVQTPPGAATQPRTPQQMLEELQRMRQGQSAGSNPNNP